MTKPRKKKTVTAWAFTYRHANIARGNAAMRETRRAAATERAAFVDGGFVVGPIIKVEVPL